MMIISSFIFLILTLTLTTIDATADVIENNNLKVSLSKDSGLVMINEVMLKESQMFDVDVDGCLYFYATCTNAFLSVMMRQIVKSSRSKRGFCPVIGVPLGRRAV